MIDTARQRRAQQVEAKYTSDLRKLRQEKEDALQQLDERYKILKASHRMSRIDIKEDFRMKRLDLKTQIERKKDLRADVRHARSCDLPLDDLPDLDTLTTEIEKLLAAHIKLDRQEHDAIVDADNKFEARCKDINEERRALNIRYVNDAEKLHDAYLQHVEENRQQREAEEGGAL